MSKHKVVLGLVVAVVLGTLLVGQVFAAGGRAAAGGGGAGVAAGGGGGAGGAGGGAGGPGAGGRFDPAQMRQRTLDRVKEVLAPTDEEWKALQPKVEKLLTARDAAGTGRMMMGGMGGGRGGAAPAPAEGAVVTPVEKATNDLRTTLDNQSAKPEEIKAKLTALREAREKAKQDLAKAQGDLREALSLRQESQCVLMGMLD